MNTNVIMCLIALIGIGVCAIIVISAIESYLYPKVTSFETIEKMTKRAAFVEISKGKQSHELYTGTTTKGFSTHHYVGSGTITGVSQQDSSYVWSAEVEVATTRLAEKYKDALFSSDACWNQFFNTLSQMRLLINKKRIARKDIDKAGVYLYEIVTGNEVFS